jgi:regulatory protein
MSDSQRYSFLKAKEKIEAFCAYQDRCHFEVENKLRSMGVDTDDVYALLAYLVENKFLDEQRFADSFVSGKVNIKKWGRMKIKYHLQQKRISSACIEMAFKEIDDEIYFDNLKTLAELKYKEKKGTIYERKMKTMRFLYQRGYENEEIMKILDILA